MWTYHISINEQFWIKIKNSKFFFAVRVPLQLSRQELWRARWYSTSRIWRRLICQSSHLHGQWRATPALGRHFAPENWTASKNARLWWFNHTGRGDRKQRRTLHGSVFASRPATVSIFLWPPNDAAQWTGSTDKFGAGISYSSWVSDIYWWRGKA